MIPNKVEGKLSTRRLFSLSVTVEVPFSSLDFGAGWHERVCLLHYVAGEVANASLLLPIIRVLYTASPEKVPSVL